MSSISRRQIGLLTLLTWVFVVPLLWHGGTNIVTQTYERAAQRFEKRVDIYQSPGGRGDQFKYSPFFAMGYVPFTWVGDSSQALLWALFNIWIFWLGITQWFLFQRTSSRWMGFALLLCAMELNGSVRYQQVNALMTGLILLGLASLRDGRPAGAGGWLALATNLKILPALFAGALLLPIRRRYADALITWSLGLLVLPGIWLGVRGTREALLHWAGVLLGDLQTKGLLDIRTVLATWGWPGLGEGMRVGVLFLSLSILLALRLRLRAAFPWGLFYTVAASCLLLWNPRSESPTFVLIAPAYLFLVAFALQSSARDRKIVLAVVGVCAFFITFCFSDLWPKSVWDPREMGFFTKPLGALVVWLLACGLSVKELARAKTQPVFRRNSSV